MNKVLPLQAVAPLSQTSGTLPLSELIDNEHCQYDELDEDDVQPNEEAITPPTRTDALKRSAVRRRDHGKPLAKRIPVRDTKITSKYGMRVHPITGKHKFHNGVDFSAKLNQPVYSVLDGKVMRCGPRGALGIAVEIYHPSKRTTTIYGHLNQKLVARGQVVKAGQPVGLAGTTGRSTGVHLHFIVKQNARTVEPLRFLASLPGYMPGQQSSYAAVATAVPEERASTNLSRTTGGNGGNRNNKVDSLPIVAAAVMDPELNFGIASEKANIGIGARSAMVANISGSAAARSRSGMRAQLSATTKRTRATSRDLRLALGGRTNKRTNHKPAAHVTHIAKVSAKSKHKHLIASNSANAGKASSATKLSAANTKPSALSRIADGARLAAELASELSNARQALSSAQQRSATAAMLLNEGAISVRDANRSKQAVEDLQQKVNKLQGRI